MKSIEELIKIDLGNLTREQLHKFLYRPIDLSKQDQPRVYILGDLFGIIITDNKYFTILEHITADIPSAWLILPEGSTIDCWFTSDLRKLLDLTEKWIKKYGKC